MAGSKGNRVKSRNFRGIEGWGLIWEVNFALGFIKDDYWIRRIADDGVKEILIVEEGDDVTEFFGITEYVPDGN